MKQSLCILIICGFLSWASPGLSSVGVVERATGNGNKVVGPFKVTERWEVRWDFDGIALQIFVNQKDSLYPDLPVDESTQRGSGQGSSRQEKGGTFYLKVVAQGSWSIIIVDLP